MYYYLILLVIAIVIIGYIYYKKSEIRRLKERYRRLMFLGSNKLAEESLQYQITRLKLKYPGRTYKWYIEKVIYDLERDRR